MLVVVPPMMCGFTVSALAGAENSTLAAPTANAVSGTAMRAWRSRLLKKWITLTPDVKCAQEVPPCLRLADHMTDKANPPPLRAGRRVYIRQRPSDGPSARRSGAP